MTRAFTEYLWFETKERYSLVNITEKIEDLVERSEISEGICLVSAMHITSAIWVNDEESGLKEDLKVWLEGLAPAKPDYLHHRTGEDNADAHLKRTLLHHQTVLPVTGGKLDLGPWEQVFYAEFDGQRRKRVIVKILGV
jgi:secondary thiamine-phosphate synthase enzyme